MENNKNKSSLAPIPKKGETYYFYLCGKIKIKDEFEAIIEQVIPYEEGEQYCVRQYYAELEDVVETPILDIWLENQDSTFWLLAETTDYIIEASIPNLTPCKIYFARTIDGEWYSLEVNTPRHLGLLDVTGEYHNKLHSTK